MGERLLEIYPKSFHYFQTNEKQRENATGAIQNKIELLKSLRFIDEQGLTSKGKFASTIYGYELPLSELFVDGFFETATMEEIACVLSAITFEPRKGYEFNAELPDSIFRIRKITRKLSKKIEKRERHFHLEPTSQKFHYHLSTSIMEWMRGTPFESLYALAEVDEGEIVRNFRMVIQLCRELLNTQGCSPAFYERISSLLRLIKRDVVDAEKQLSVGD
jgi:superfamily II RNA helicase